MITYICYLFFIVRIMKILKLLPTILLLNCIVPSPEATASLRSIFLHVANHPTFFNAISFADFKEQISHGINEPLSDSELTDFTTKYFNRENILDALSSSYDEFLRPDDLENYLE